MLFFSLKIHVGEANGKPKVVIRFKGNLQWRANLRGSDCKYRESVDRLKNSKTLIACQKNTFGELSSKILFKLSGTLLFSRNLEKTVLLN